MFFENLEIRIRGFLIESVLGLRVVYLKFEVFGFGWGVLFWVDLLILVCTPRFFHNGTYRITGRSRFDKK
jgi:hypothetical protein